MIGVVKLACAVHYRSEGIRDGYIADPSSPEDVPLGWLTPEKVRGARAQIAVIHEDLRRQGIDLSRLPDPVEELVKARDAGYRDW